jgi:streptogramin lyase
MKHAHYASTRLLAAVTLLLAGTAAAAGAKFGPVIAPREISELVPQATLHVGHTADWVVITPDAVWVGSTGPNAVHRIDPKLNKLVATVKLTGEPCAGMTAGFNSLWVPLCSKPNALARVDLTTNTQSGVFKAGPAGPEGGIAASDDQIWMMLDKHGKLAAIDPLSGVIKRIVHIPPGSYNPRYSDGQVWVTRADGAEITGVDPSNGKIKSTVRTGPGPRFLASGDGSLWTLNQGDGTLTQIDAQHAQATKTIALGIPGHGGDIALGGGMVWTTMPKIPLSAVDSATGAVACQWVGPGGDSLAIGHGSIWLTDYTAGTISRIDLVDALRHCEKSPSP